MTSPGFRKRMQEADKLIETEWLKPKPKGYKSKYHPARDPKSKPPKPPAVPFVPKSKTIRLLERDGNNCWLCHEPLNGDMSIEHLLAEYHGGASCMANYVLCHRSCNVLLGHKPIAEKVRMRESNLGRTP